MITFPNVPIVGQPIEVVAIEVEAIAYCNCNREERTIIRLVEGRPSVCLQCKTTYMLLGTVGGTPELNIDIRRHVEQVAVARGGAK